MKILVLGGGSSQINLITRAGEAGYRVVLADRDPDAPGRSGADSFVGVSTFDVEGITRAALSEGVAAVVTAGSDQPVLSAAVASERAGLPFPLSPQEARAVTNKREMKRILSDAGLPTAPWNLLPAGAVSDSSGYSRLNPPWVVKPLDSQGQRGVMKLDTPEAVAEAIPYVLGFSREREVLIEEYYPSREITVSGWVCGGRSVIFAVVDRVTRENPPSLGVCVAHRHPSTYLRRYGRTVREVENLTQKIVTAFGLKSGPLYFQYLLGDRGIIVNEIACRLGGAYEDLVQPSALGLDPVRYLLSGLEKPGLECAAVLEEVRALRSTDRAGAQPGDGATEDVHELRSSGGEAGGKPFTVALLFARPGVVESYEGVERAQEIREVEEIRFLLPPGTEIREIANSTQRIGYAVVVGETIQTVNEAIAVLFSTIAVRDSRGNDLLINTAGRCMLTDDA